ncbi:hypothetical protein TNCT_663401 [Trichonephila clavata]|uniref:Uncharacterized protein n=1 Tax=Trichonephila clavata TaxID=2740835 RepID=A0A8X6KSZ4_TRICU|nr:hypothetical protein TNCT_663401 [Trichonephila clavata]
MVNAPTKAETQTVGPSSCRDCSYSTDASCPLRGSLQEIVRWAPVLSPPTHETVQKTVSRGDTKFLGMTAEWHAGNSFRRGVTSEFLRRCAFPKHTRCNDPTQISKHTYRRGVTPEGGVFGVMPTDFSGSANSSIPSASDASRTTRATLSIAVGRTLFP